MLQTGINSAYHIVSDNEGKYFYDQDIDLFNFGVCYHSNTNFLEITLDKSKVVLKF